MHPQNMSRRDFLHLGVVGLSSTALLTACGGLLPAQGSPAAPENYYTLKREDILKDAKSILGYLQQSCTEKYDGDLAAALVEETRARFETQLPSLPYIGGDQNDLTLNLTHSSLALAFYRVMLTHTKTVEETGEILYRTMQTAMSAEPLIGVMGWLSNSALAQSKLRDEALTSQKRSYPGDWVFEFVEGNGQDLDFGINYQECGICKYFASEGAAELTPYMCLLDFPSSESMNTGLVRTSTLALGGACCDFRFKSGRPCQMEWTPAFLK